jgi:hypothetical protein
MVENNGSSTMACPTRLFGLVLVLPLLVPAAASAAELRPLVGAAAQADAGDLRALENRLQRQQFQQQQQQLREQDRLSIPLRQAAPQVPVMRPGCQIQVYGNIRTCR